MNKILDSPSARALGVSLVVGYVIGWSELARRSLGLTPGLAVPFRLWTFVTYVRICPASVCLVLPLCLTMSLSPFFSFHDQQAYVPASLMSLLATAPVATYVAQVLDPIQGGQGLALIVLVTVTAAGVATWITTVIMYVVSSMVNRAAGEAMIGVLYTPICGFYAGVVGLLVGVKQAIPGELTINDYKINTAVLPLAYVGVVCLVQMVWGRMVDCLIVVYGLVAAWCWLRYFHPSGVAGLVGDPSDEFKLLSFLPESMQKHSRMRAFSDRCDERMRAWAEQAKDFRGVLMGSGGGRPDAGVGSSAPVEGLTSGDATRRRERGLKSLEARLGGNETIPV